MSESRHQSRTRSPNGQLNSCKNYIFIETLHISCSKAYHIPRLLVRQNSIGRTIELFVTWISVSRDCFEVESCVVKMFKSWMVSTVYSMLCELTAASWSFEVESCVVKMFKSWMVSTVYSMLCELTAATSWRFVEQEMMRFRHLRETR